MRATVWAVLLAGAFLLFAAGGGVSSGLAAETPPSAITTTAPPALVVTTDGAVPSSASAPQAASEPLLASSPTSSAAAPVVARASEPMFSWSGYFEAIGIMLLLLGGLWFLLWMMRRYGKFRFLPSPGGFERDALRMEAQLPLGPRRGLVVVRFLNERLLLGVTDQQISVLSAHVLREAAPGQADVAEQGSAATSDDAVSFAALLREADGEPSTTPQRP